MTRYGVVSYKGVEQGKSYSYFRLKENVLGQDTKPYRQYKSGRTIPIRVYDLMTRSLQQEPSKYVSIDEIADRLIVEFPEYGELNKKQINNAIAALLSRLERQEYVERQKFNYGFHSEITLSDQQREGITSLVTVIDKFKNGDRHTIEEGRRFAQRVVNDPNRYSYLMLKAKEASPFANKMNREETQAYLVSILSENPNSTLNQIQRFLEENYSKILTTNGILHHMSSLVKEGKIAFEKTKSGNVYRVAESENTESH